MQASIFTSLFVLFLLIDVAVRFWLARRQINYVQSHRAQVPEQFSANISLTSHQRAADYTIARSKLRCTESLFDAALLLIITLGGVLAWFNHLLASLIEDSLWRDVALISGVVIALGVAQLPFTIYRQFGLEAKFGFNRMTPSLFVADTFKGLVIGAVLGLPLLSLILWLMQSAGEFWWFWAWVSWAIFNLVVMLVFPTWIAPLFNKFTPLEDVTLRDRIQGLAKRCEFEIQGLFVMDGSKRSAHGNAYFTGFGKSRRIVFFDTLLSKLTGAEIEAVLAHELGHFKHKHITKRLLVSLITSLVFFALLGWLCQQTWFFQGLGVPVTSGVTNNGLALLLFFLVVPVFTFLLTPLTSWLSRRDEFQADQFAVRQSQASDLVSALVKLFNDNAATLTPDPLHSAFYDSHPPAMIRIKALSHT